MADQDKIDDFELVNCVATGGVTQIWEVKRAGSSQPLAMKLMLDEALKDPAHRQALKHEASVGKSMQHPNIISIFDVKLTKKLSYYTMEYFRSGNLKGLIRNDLPQAKARVKSLMEALAQALGYFHEKGWIHRDIKPDNVLMSKGGEVRLIDFSLASRPSNVILRAMTKKSRVSIQGTRTYIAPELVRREAITPSVDIYSLGILLYETLIGNPPFRTANPNDLLMMHVRDKPARPSELDDNITQEADNLVMRMLGKKPKDRHANMQEVYAEVRNLKFFKEDPVKVAKERADALAAGDAQAQEDRLNSRRDAERDRSKDGERKPAPKPKPKPILAKETKPQPKPEQQPAAPQQQPGAPWGQMPGQPMMPGMFPGAMPGQMPQYPGMMPQYPGMMPGQPMPGQPMPGQPMPGQQMPGQQMPGQPMPGQPMPGQPMPGQPMPGQPMPGQPMPGQPMPGQQMPGQQMPGQQMPGQQMPGQQMPGQQMPQPSVPQPSAPQPTSAPKPSAPKATETKNEPPKKAPEDIPLANFDDLQIE
ncbi:Serine/threonine-protein kinase PknB [Thalassoglobus neptunius]|uniref:Serine/threonine-protein kinase PknB n=1 Tax=Thalassoglobus neptunius TaxID=1938619 RepID=A0A5C5WP47_9PLAN|nr:serine/threonine-protein kinase [Thalassoglobus neptunius]TWT52200.1 Serine/threonine-protein kinase PknB [Thalassoglobus neptunius]